MLLGKYSKEQLAGLDPNHANLAVGMADTFWSGSGGWYWAPEYLAFCDLPKVTVEVSARVEKQTQILK